VGDAWYGDNLNRALFRTEGNWNVNTENFEETEVQALYSRTITRYFDLHAGLRYDFDPSPSRESAPYIGMAYERKYGRTVDFARREGDSVQDLRCAGGIRVWF